jgi:hypothetical protein
LVETRKRPEKRNIILLKLSPSLSLFLLPPYMCKAQSRIKSCFPKKKSGKYTSAALPKVTAKSSIAALERGGGGDKEVFRHAKQRRRRPTPKKQSNNEAFNNDGSSGATGGASQGGTALVARGAAGGLLHPAETAAATKFSTRTAAAVPKAETSRAHQRWQQSMPKEMAVAVPQAGQAKA